MQNSNAYGSSGASTDSRNGNTAYAQHQTNAYGSAGSVTSSNGAKAYGASGANGSAAVGQTANGNKYATANGNVYSNTGSGWQGSSSNTPKYNTSTYSGQSTPKTSSTSSGWGQQEKSSGSSAFNSGGGGWQAREASARGAQAAWRWRWLGRSQVNQMAAVQEITTLVSNGLEDPTMRRSGD